MPKRKTKVTRKKSPVYSESSSDYESSDYESSPSPVKKKKRVPSAYQKFCAKERSKIKRFHPNMKPQDVMKELGKRWQKHKK